MVVTLCPKCDKHFYFNPIVARQEPTYNEKTGEVLIECPHCNYIHLLLLKKIYVFFHYIEKAWDCQGLW